MADFSEWGAEASPGRLIDLDQQNRALTQMRLLGGMNELAEAPSRMRLLSAQAMHAEAQAEGLRQQAAMDAATRAAYLKQAVAPPSPNTLSPEESLAFPAAGIAGPAALEHLPVAPGAMPQMAQMAGPQDPFQAALSGMMPAYNAARASGNLKEIAAIGPHIIAAAGAMSRAAVDQQKMKWYDTRDKHAILDEGAGILSTATDQASLDAATQQFQNRFHEPAPWAGKAYSPNLVQAYQKEILSAKDRLNLEQRQSEEAAREKARAKAEAQKDIENNLRRLRIQNEERARPGVDKAGGKFSGTPPAGLVSMASGILGKEAPGLPDPVGASRELAARAQARMKNNPGVDAGEALRQVMKEERDAGNLVTVPGAGKSSYGHGTSAADAIPLPGDKRTLRGTAKNPVYYQTPKGIGKYFGERDAKGRPIFEAAALPTSRGLYDQAKDWASNAVATEGDTP